MDLPHLDEKLIELFPAAVYVVEAPSGVIRRYNRRAAELWGREPQPGDPEERFCGSFRLYQPDGTLMPRESGPVGQVLRTGASVRDAEAIMERPDGSRRLVRANADPIRGEDGAVAAVINVFEDITEQGALRSSRERHQMVAEATSEVIYDWDMAEDRGLWDGAMETVFGYRPEEVGTRFGWWEERVHPEDHSRVLSSLRAWLREGEPFWCDEYRFRRADGAYAAVLDRGYAVRDEAGCAVRVLGAMGDISERKRAEEERTRLLEGEREAHAQAEAARQRLSFLAEAGEILWSSSLDYRETLTALARLSVPFLADCCVVDVVEESGVIGRVAAACADPAKDEIAFDLCRFPPDPTLSHGVPEVIRSGKPLLHRVVPDWWLKGATRSEEHLEVVRRLGPMSGMMVPLIARGRTLGALTFFMTDSGRRYEREDLELAQDLARRAALAIDNARLYGALQQEGRNKDRFLAMLGHELRNPLGPIRNAVEILERRGSGDPQEQRCLGTIKRQVRHEARLIDDLLNITRIAEGKLLLRFEPLDLTELIGAALEDHRDVVEQCGLELRTELPDEPVCIFGDPVRIAQIVGNLLSNAVKFTDGGGRVTVHLSPSDNGHWAELTVRDTGIGIRPELLPRMFEAFAQEERSQERSRSGLGLGLAVVKTLVEMHGGEIRAHSEGPGRGAEFIIQVPLADCETLLPAQGVTAAEDLSALGTTPQESALQVLVIEDNRDAAATMGDLLELFGCVGTLAYSGPEGIRAARDRAPDVVLCDIDLPGMSGYEVAAALRENPATSDLCLVAVTGYGRPEDRQTALEVGFDHFLVKPVDPNDLQTLLRDIGNESREGA